MSVQSADGKGVEELAEAGKLPHEMIAVTTVKELRSLGFDVIRSSGIGEHATLVTNGELTEEAAKQLSDLFNRQPNPRMKKP